MQFPPELIESLYPILSQFVWIGLLMLLSFQGQKIQMMGWMSSIRKNLIKLKGYSQKASDITLKLIKEVGKPNFDPKERMAEFIEFVLISPVDLDPNGVLKRLEHLS